LIAFIIILVVSLTGMFFVLCSVSREEKENSSDCVPSYKMTVDGVLGSSSLSDIAESKKSKKKFGILGKNKLADEKTTTKKSGLPEALGLGKISPKKHTEDNLALENILKKKENKNFIDEESLTDKKRKHKEKQGFFSRIKFGKKNLKKKKSEEFVLSDKSQDESVSAPLDVINLDIKNTEHLNEVKAKEPSLNEIQQEEKPIDNRPSSDLKNLTEKKEEKDNSQSKIDQVIEETIPTEGTASLRATSVETEKDGSEKSMLVDEKDLNDDSIDTPSSKMKGDKVKGVSKEEKGKNQNKTLIIPEVGEVISLQGNNKTTMNPKKEVLLHEDTTHQTETQRDIKEQMAKVEKTVQEHLPSGDKEHMDDFDELQKKYDRLDELLNEKNQDLEKTQESLSRELRNRNEFEKIKNVLEEELMAVKGRSRNFQGEIANISQESENQKKRIFELEEKAESLGQNLLKKEEEVFHSLKKLQDLQKELDEKNTTDNLQSQVSAIPTEQMEEEAIEEKSSKIEEEKKEELHIHVSAEYEALSSASLSTDDQTGDDKAHDDSLKKEPADIDSKENKKDGLDFSSEYPGLNSTPELNSEVQSQDAVVSKKNEEHVDFSQKGDLNEELSLNDFSPQGLSAEERVSDGYAGSGFNNSFANKSSNQVNQKEDNKDDLSDSGAYNNIEEEVEEVEFLTLPTENSILELKTEDSESFKKNKKNK